MQPELWCACGTATREGKHWKVRLSFFDEPHRLLLHCGNHLFRADIRKVAVYHEKRMNDAGNPEKKGQNQVQNGLKGLAAQEDGDWRADDGEEVSHRTKIDGFRFSAIRESDYGRSGTRKLEQFCL